MTCNDNLSQVLEDVKKLKVMCTFVQALRVLSGRTVHRGTRSTSIGKGKVHRCTGTEALYRPYGP